LREAELELRLDERDQLGVRRDLDALELRNGRCEREVGDVDRHDLDGLRDERAIESAQIRRLQVDDACVLPQRAEQLAVPCVDGVDAPDAGGEQHAGEPARGGAHVERDAPHDLDVERGERRLELRLAPEPPRHHDLDPCISADERARVAHGEAVDVHAAARDQGLRIGEAGVQSVQTSEEGLDPMAAE
jgi:hypothetical protein